MNTLILILAVLLGTGFVLGLVGVVSKSSDVLRLQIMSWLKLSGRKNFDVSEFQSQHAILYSSLHYLTILVGGLSAWLTVHNFFLPTVVLILLYVAPGYWLARKRRKRKATITAELPDVLLFISSALRAGSSLSVALEVLVRDQRGPLGEELSVVLKEQRLGASFDDSLLKMSDRLAIPDFVLVVVALRVSKEVGGNLSEPLQILAGTLRRKAILEGRIEALTAQGKIQGLVMSLFPFMLLAILYFLQPSTKLLFTTTIGLVVLTIACVMLYCGHKVIKKIVAIDI